MDNEKLGELPRAHQKGWIYTSAQMRSYASAEVQRAVSEERERLLSMPNLMHACDHLGVPSDGTHCDILRRALYRA